jgi:hypothetical protein
LHINKLLAPDIEDESVIIVLLFYDVGKVGYPDKPYYLTNTDIKDQAKGIRYKINIAIPHKSSWENAKTQGSLGLLKRI